MRFYLVIIFLNCIFLSFAQGNLQFNQVLLLSATSNNSAQWSVPAGKVWKIEALGAHSPYTYVYLNNQLAYEHNGTIASTSGGYYRHSASSPIWLPEGTTLGHNSAGTNTFRWFSIIEFNIIP